MGLSQDTRMPVREDVATTRILRRCSQIARGSALLTIAITVIGLVGWIVDSATLAGISPRFPRLMPNTAVGLLLVSSALLALERDRPQPLVRRGGMVAALGAGAVGLATLVELVGGVDLGIDRLLVPAGACHGDPTCGRPSLNAGAALVLLAGALLTLDVRDARRYRPAQILAAIVGLTSFAALAGYVYGAPPLYGVPGHIPETALSVHATIAFSALAVGVLCARPRVGAMAILISARPGGAVARRFLVAVLVAPIVGIAFSLGQSAGLYSPAMSAALLSVTAMVVSIVWVLRTAQTLDATDRALHATERRHHTFVEQAYDAIFIADLTGQLVFVNPAACELLGYTRDELLEKGIADLVPPEQLATIAEVRERLLRGGTERSERSLVAKSGELVPVEVTAVITHEGQWQASVRDIRERQRIQQIENENMHRLAVTNEATLVFTQALANIVESGFEAVLRAIADEARLATDADGATVEVRGAAPATIAVGTRASIARGLSASVRIGDRELGVIHVARDITRAPFAEEDGTILNALAARAALVVEAARSFAREVEARARLQALLDNMPAGVVLVGEGGAEPVHNRFLDDFVDAEGFRRDDHPVQRALRTRELVVERMSLERRDGTFVTMLVTAAPVDTAQGGPAGAVATFQDITAIEELERLREDWNTIVAHELRQPLNGIGLAVQTLERGAAGPTEVREQVQQIRGAARRLDRMLRDLSDVSRADGSRLELAIRPVHLGALLRDIVERSREAVRMTEHGSARPTVMLDAMRIEQVMANLLSNAAKYGKAGVPIELSIDWRDDDVVVSVTNENGGAPIAPAEADRIFDRFSRAEAASQSGVPGLGIGLYVCRRLVEAHGGTIALDTTRDGHTSFRVTLPIEARRARSGLRLVDPPASRRRA